MVVNNVNCMVESEKSHQQKQVQVMDKSMKSRLKVPIPTRSPNVLPFSR